MESLWVVVILCWDVSWLIDNRWQELIFFWVVSASVRRVGGAAGKERGYPDDCGRADKKPIIMNIVIAYRKNKDGRQRTKLTDDT